MGAGDAIIQLDNSGGESSESDGEGTEVKQNDLIYYTADNKTVSAGKSGNVLQTFTGAAQRI